MTNDLGPSYCRQLGKKQPDGGYDQTKSWKSAVKNMKDLLRYVQANSTAAIFYIPILPRNNKNDSVRDRKITNWERKRFNMKMKKWINEMNKKGPAKMNICEKVNQDMYSSKRKVFGHFGKKECYGFDGLHFNFKGLRRVAKALQWDIGEVFRFETTPPIPGSLERMQHEARIARVLPKPQHICRECRGIGHEFGLCSRLGFIK